MPPELDEHILSTLTAEEVAAISEDQSPEEAAAVAAVDSGSEDGPDGEDENEEDGVATADAAATDAAPAPQTPAPEPGADTESSTDPVAPVAQSFSPTYQAQLPEDFAAQEASIKERSEALAAKFKGGELDFDQYRVEAEALAKSERALDEIRLKATLSQEMAAQSAQQQWTRTVQAFITTTAKADGVDYLADTAKNEQFDFYVRALANDPKHSDKSGEWFLSEAHKVVMALNGLTPQKTPPAKAPPAVGDSKATRKPPLDAAPKTLAQVPGGYGPGDVDGNEFADIDRLKGDAQEEAIRKMTPAQRERYMAGV